MIALTSRVFMSEEMRWTLEATCSACLTQTVAPLIMGMPVRCAGCGVAISIDPAKTVFHRSGGAGRENDELRSFRWGTALVRS